MKRTLLALLLSVAMVATTVLTAFPVVFATGDAEDAAPAIDRKGYYFSMDFDEGETGYTPTLGQGASIEDGELTMVPVGTTQTAVFDFPDITLPVTGLNNRKICLSFAFKATSDLNANAYVDLITNGGQGKDKIYLQFSGGKLQGWATANAAVTIASGLNDNQWHIVEAFYTFKNDTTWEISVSVDGGTPHVMNATKLVPSGLGGFQGQYDVMKTTTVLKSIQTRITNIDNPKGSIVFDNFAIGTGSSVNTKDNGNDYYGKYAGTYLDLGFDAEDLAGITAPEGSTLVVENGTMNLSTQKANTTGAHVPYAINIPFDKVNIDITKPFTFSYRLKMSNATASFVQMFTDFTGNQFGQVNANGAVCIPIMSNGAVNAYNKATVHNIKTKGEWHTFDYYVTPLEGGKYSVVVYMNGDEVLRTGDSATFDTAFGGVKFQNSASKFEVKLFASTGYSASQKLDVEFDYFRIGDGTLYEEPHVCEASHEGPFDGMIITAEGHWFNCVDPECDERVDFVAHVEGIPCDDFENGACGWGVEESSDSYTMSISSLLTTGKVGDTVLLAVQLMGGIDESYAAGEVVLKYDTSALIFDATASKLGGATAAVTADGLKIEEYGASKQTGGDIYYLYFTAAKAGEYAITVESAGFSDLGSASSFDLYPATVENALVTYTIAAATFDVTLDSIFSGATTVTNGADYTFEAVDADNYIYATPVAKVNGVEVNVTVNEDGTYTVKNVTGALVITGTRAPKSYKVTINGEDAEDATYGTDYIFDIPADVAVDGATPGKTYALTSITIGGVNYTGYTLAEKKVTIPGAAITGAIEIVITETTVNPETYTVTVNKDAAVGDLEYEATAIAGVDYTFSFNGKGGFTYTVTAKVGGTEVTVTSAQGGTWTIAAADVKGNIEITITATLNLDGVAVGEYLQLNGTKMWIVTIADWNLEEGYRYTYNGEAMYLYNGKVVYLVVADSLTVDDAKALIAVEDGTAEELVATTDVNGTGTLDANDAQLVYNMYNGDYAGFTENVTMEKFLLADVNGDCVINVEDSAAIVAAVLAAM